MEGSTLATGRASCCGVVEAGTGKGWDCVAEPNTLATIWEGVMPNTGTMGGRNGSPLHIG